MMPSFGTAHVYFTELCVCVCSVLVCFCSAPWSSYTYLKLNIYLWEVGKSWACRPFGSRKTGVYIITYKIWFTYFLLTRSYIILVIYCKTRMRSGNLLIFRMCYFYLWFSHTLILLFFSFTMFESIVILMIYYCTTEYLKKTQQTISFAKSNAHNMICAWVKQVQNICIRSKYNVYRLFWKPISNIMMHLSWFLTYGYVS